MIYNAKIFYELISKCIIISFGIIFFSLLGSNFSLSQEKLNHFQNLLEVENLYDSKQYDEALKYLKKAEPIFRSKGDWKLWYKCYWWITIIHAEETKNFEQATSWLRTGLKIAKEEELDFFIISKFYNLFGYIYYYNGELEKAFHAYLNSLEWREKSGNFEGIESIYSNLGMLYIIRKEYTKSLDYLYKSLYINKKNKYFYEAHKVCFHLGITYNLVHEPDSALVYYDKALYYLGAEDSHTLARKSEVYISLGQWKEAEKWAKMALQFAYEKTDSTFVYKKLADIYFGMNNSKQAIFFYNKAIEINGIQNRETAKNYIGIADIFAQQKLYTQAIEHYKKALRCFENKSVEGEGIFNAISQDGSPPDIWYCIALDKMGTALESKAMWKKAQKQSFTDTLLLALRYYEQVIFNARLVRESYIEEDAKLLSRGDYHTTHEKALGILHQLSQHSPSYTSKAFSLIERSKSAVLLESIQEQEALQFAEIPDSLSQHLAALKNTIASLAYQKSHSTGKDYQNLQDSIFNTKRALERTLKKTIETYPDYKDYQQELEPVSLSEVQQELVESNSLLLEFFMGEEKGYVASIGKGRSEIVEIEDMDLVRQHIEVLHGSLSDKKAVVENPQEAYRQFAESASWLYDRLLAESLQGFEGDELVVIPDGLLGYVPFEVLLTAMPDTTKRRYKQLPYLLKKYRVSYAYSATLLKKSKEKEAASKEFSIAAFAPFAVGENALAERGIADSILQNLPALSHSKFELDALSQMFAGHFYYAEDAQEQRVKQTCSEASILHFSTHTLIDHDDPMYSVMLFAGADSEAKEQQENEGRLYAYELYNRRIGAEMAVLSACETGYGKLSRGEGILSLSRAFVHAGCPSTVMSLWQIDDKASAEVMLHFYRHLQNGSTKDEALQQAKLDYLQETESAYAHPYYWAALVSTGNQRALNRGWDWTYSELLGWSLLGGMLFFGVLVVVNFQKVKRRFSF